jgi:dihydrodipicolinate synthase/N-acetylneuraminate lyase
LYSLTPAEYTRVIELTALAVEDRVPVIAGVGFGQRLAVEMAQAARRRAPTASSLSRLTTSRLKMRDCFEYYRAIGEAHGLEC